MDNYSTLIKNKDYIIIELGPGDIKCCKEAITIDKVKKESVDIIHDINLGFDFISSESVDEIHAYHVIEHVDNIEYLMKEFYRILKRNGRVFLSVPHFSNPYFYSDYTHKTMWGLYSFCYFSKQQYFKRSVPKYYNDVNFEIVNIKIKFKSPFIIRNKFKKLLEKIFNFNKFLQEFFEENLVYIFPAYEIYVEMIKND